MKSLLDTEDGDTIDIDFADLYGLCDVPCQDTGPQDAFSVADADFLAGGWSSSVIEDSLETIRTVLATANIPADNRDIIEKSLTTLKNAIDLPPVPGSPPVLEAVEAVDSTTPELEAGPQAVLQLEDWPGVDTSGHCYAGLTPAAAEHEDRVREALGLAGEVTANQPQAEHPSGQAGPLPPEQQLYNESFCLDRERQQEEASCPQLAQLQLWVEAAAGQGGLQLEDSMPSLEEVSCLQDLHSPAPDTPRHSSVASVDNVLDQSFLLSGGDVGEGWGKAGAKTVTRLVPYRIKKIGDSPDSSTEPGTAKRERPTRDEKAVAAQQIPYTVDYIIHCSMDQFNEILGNKSLDTEQLNLCRDIRKRGKNKIAARNCRKRKGEQILQLEEELEVIRDTKRRTRDHHHGLLQARAQAAARLQQLEARVLGLLAPGRPASKLVLQGSSLRLVDMA